MAEPAEQNQVPQVHEVQVLQVQQPAPVAGQNVNPPAPPGAAREVTFLFLSFSPPFGGFPPLSCHLFHPGPLWLRSRGCFVTSFMFYGFV